MMRLDRIAEGARRAAIARIAVRLHARFPELEVVPHADGVTLAGRGLSRRMLDEVDLRDVAGLVREERT